MGGTSETCSGGHLYHCGHLCVLQELNYWTTHRKMWALIRETHLKNHSQTTYTLLESVKLLAEEGKNKVKMILQKREIIMQRGKERKARVKERRKETNQRRKRIKVRRKR